MSGSRVHTSVAEASSKKRSNFVLPENTTGHLKAASIPPGGSHTVTGTAGKSSAIPDESLAAVRIPDRVRNRIMEPSSSFPVLHMTNAAASVAWPHRSTSASGVNQRRLHPSSSLWRKAVSEWFMSAATLCIQVLSFSSSVMQTAAGLPQKGVDVKESTMWISALMPWSVLTPDHKRPCGRKDPKCSLRKCGVGEI
ncbi:MAG: hypothetical protein A4E42_01217 [Methanoregulaceae archaeon PtaU1.Bin222]|nr:MAG: hypothetical protein A4E42_01217 [Methanoregulaceae archaeon PtaU1.Bin222]